MSAEYENECRLARALAGATSKNAALRFAEAVVGSPEHEFIYTSRSGACRRLYGIKVTYHNDFGPTCGVDDTVETMLMSDWIKACDRIVRLKLEKAGVDPELYDCEDHRPSVTFVPEQEDPIIHEVTLEFTVAQDVWSILRKADWGRTGIRKGDTHAR